VLNFSRNLKQIVLSAAIGAIPNIAHSAEAPQCALGNGIKHVVHIQFDNVHLRRDNPNVPSDLELMPNLLNFLENNGSISGRHYTPLISHTATDILTILTGVYGDRMGVPVSNSYRVFDASNHISSSHPSFVYWTATDATDHKPVLLNEKGKIAPAPWVPFTRAGCDVGAFSIANMEFETLPGDIGTVYGTTSPEFQSVQASLSSPDPAIRQRALTDWLGIAVHCAKGSALCVNGKPDLLPDEPAPNGDAAPSQYVGFNALYGAVNVQPAISSDGPVKDIDGNVISDAFGHPGFPNVFNPTATQSLGYAAAMLEAGVQVIYVYIADAHDNRGGPGTFGPGEAGYLAQLTGYDLAFGKFFSRLSSKGVDPSNTLFIVTADENDHFVGGAPSPANCDGVTTPCAYFYPGTTNRSVGELTANLDSLLLTQKGRVAAPFLIHSDDAPTIYIDGNPQATDALTRNLEQDIASLKWTNPLPGKNNQTDMLTDLIADRLEMKLLHMLTASPARDPSFTLFGNPDYFFQTTRGSLPLASVDCSANPSLCIFQNSNFAWNHGDVQQDIVRSWFGMAGPGVKRLGRNGSVFSDHTDLRPTMLAILGLKDDYMHDGRVLVEKLDGRRLPLALASFDRERDGELDAGYIALARTYKQLNAPLGALGTDSLKFATRSIRADDGTYSRYLAVLGDLLAQRDALAEEIKKFLHLIAFEHAPVQHGDAGRLLERAEALLEKTRRLARSK